MDCQDVRDLIDAHAVGALTRRDSAPLEAHLSTCDGCRSLSREAAEAAGYLALAAPLRRASPALRWRLLSGASTPARARPRRVPGLWAAAAAVILALALGALAWDVVLQNRVSDLRSDNSRLTSLVDRADDAQVSLVATQEALMTDQQAMQASLQEQGTALAVALDHDARPFVMFGAGPAVGASARYVWSAEYESGLLYTSDLPSPPAGMVYQFWLITEERPIDGGTFAPAADGVARLLVRRPAVSGRIVAIQVSLEPAGGSALPSGTTVLVGEPSAVE